MGFGKMFMQDLDKELHRRGTSLAELTYRETVSPTKIPLLRNLKTYAVILGIAGAALVASPLVHHQFWGFSVWLIANGIWVYEGRKAADMHIQVLFGIYWILAAAGWYRCLG